MNDMLAAMRARRAAAAAAPHAQADAPAVVFPAPVPAVPDEVREREQPQSRVDAGLFPVFPLFPVQEVASDDRHACSECAHYADSGHCTNWRAAGYLRPVLVAAAGPPMRCAGYAPAEVQPRDDAPNCLMISYSAGGRG